MRVLAVAAFALAAVAALPGYSHAVDAAAVEGCHRQLFRGLESDARGRYSTIQRCLENGKYDGSCVETDFHVEYHEQELRNRVAGDESPCQAALDSGAAVSDFGPVS